MATSESVACRWQSVADENALQRLAQTIILDSAAQSISARGEFHLVLAGGNTPREIYRGLCSAQTDWAAWRIYFGDERCLSPQDADRNSVMAADAWLDHVPIPSSSIHIIPAELNAEKAARHYATTLRHVGDFDVVLLGLGEDGHTASLFPGHDWGVAAAGHAVPDVLAVFDAPKPPPQRVSLSAQRLARARKVLFLVAGESKRSAVQAWQAGENLPARAIRPPVGVDVLVTRMLLDTLSVKS